MVVVKKGRRLIMNNQFSLLNSNINSDMIVKFISLFLYLIIIASVVMGLFNLIKFFINYNKYNFENHDWKIKIKNIHYFKEIPCDKDIFKSFFLMKAYKLYTKKTDILGALLLKWIYENKIEMKKKINNSNSKYYVEQTIILKSNISFENSFEQQIYDILRDESHNNIIEYNELDTLNSSKRYLNWIKSCEDCGRSIYEAEGLVFKNKSKYILKKKLKLEAENLVGLKKYLEDFSVIKERSSIEVKLWKEYLIFAKMFGISEKISKEFENLYPNVYYNEFIL